MNSRKPPLFRRLPCRSIERRCDEFDKRCESFGRSRYSLVEAVEERLVVSLCSHKRLLGLKKLVVHKRPSSRPSKELEQLASALEFVAERSVPPQA